MENIVGWCHVEEMNKGNVTLLIEVTPMVTNTSPVSSNYNDTKKKCESVIGGTFKTTSECTTFITNTSISISNNITAITIEAIDEEGDSPDQEVIAGYDDGCDESKCVSRGLADYEFNSSYTCINTLKIYIQYTVQFILSFQCIHHSS